MVEGQIPELRGRIRLLGLMSEAVLNRIYDILVKVCGASEGERDSFIFHQSQKNFPTEWRFIGTLGFGGKFWRGHSRIYVNCYAEHETPAARKTIEEANKQLAQVYANSQMEKDTGAGQH